MRDIGADSRQRGTQRMYLHAIEQNSLQHFMRDTGADLRQRGTQRMYLHVIEQNSLLEGQMNYRTAHCNEPPREIHTQHSQSAIIHNIKVPPPSPLSLWIHIAVDLVL